MDKTLIIAEAGVNHNGDIEKAFALVDVAAAAGADYVKFQTFRAEKLVSKSARKADYQTKNMGGGGDSTQFSMLKKLELTEEDHLQIMAYCSKKGIRFLSTGFDPDSLEYLSRIGLTLAKVPSGEITNLPYLETVARLFKEVILSTGMTTLDEVRTAMDVLVRGGVPVEAITVLHCNTEYPTPMSDVNLRAMLSIREALGVKIGYSDHTLGIEVPVAAVAMGACVIEKHFTLDKTMEGPDHAASLEPSELKAMVSAIRNIEMALSGSGIKEPSPSEKKNMVVARKSIVATRTIKKGEPFSPENIGTKRPGGGISPMRWYEVIGQLAIRDFSIDDPIEL